MRHAAMAALVGGLLACARAPERAPAPPVFYPPPPDVPRVQYLTSIASARDLPRRRSGFAEFLFGPEEGVRRLVKPYGVAMRGARLYVCDTILNNVLVLDLVSGRVDTLVSNIGADSLRNPINIAIAPDGTKYVADAGRHQVVVFDADDRLVGAFGRPGEMTPVDVAVDGERLLVADTEHDEIEFRDRATGARLGAAGQSGHRLGEFHTPTNVAVAPDGTILVSDTQNFRIQRLEATGAPRDVLGALGVGLGQFARPKGVAVDPEGRICVVDAAFNNVQIFDPAGQLLMFFGGFGPDRSNLDLPADVTIVDDPESLALFRHHVAPGHALSHLILVSSQFGEPRINVYGFLAPPGESPPPEAAP